MQAAAAHQHHGQEGRHPNVTIADVMQSNGVIHVVDTVLMPG